MNMDINFTLSILLAIPIGIAANLLTPKFQSWLERRSEEGRAKRREQLDDEYKRVKNFNENRPDYYVFLLVVSLRVTFLYAIRSIFNTVIHMVPNSIDLYFQFGEMSRHDFKMIIWRVTSILDSLITLVIVLMVINLVKDALNVAMKVRDFDEYEKEIKNVQSSNK